VDKDRRIIFIQLLNLLLDFYVIELPYDHPRLKWFTYDIEDANQVRIYAEISSHVCICICMYIHTYMYIIYVYVYVYSYVNIQFEVVYVLY
jgi:hypothetical protein